MFDKETASLDREILGFIHKHPDGPAPDREFERLAMRVFRHQFERNVSYRKFCILEKKTPPSVNSWKEIPAMPAAGFKELMLASFPARRAVKIFKTSGTTTDAKGAHFFDTLKLYEASILPPFKKYLLPDGVKPRFYFLTASPSEAPSSSLSHMMGVVNRRLGRCEGKFYVRKNQALYAELARDLSRQKASVFLLATAFSLKGFLDFLKDRKISLKLPARSRLMETGGFKGKIREVSKAALYAECVRRLGIAPHYCVSEYGMTELSSQCYDSTLWDFFSQVRRKSIKEGPAWLRVVVIDPATGREAKKGRRGLLKHFDLANRGSVLAVQTEDMGVARDSGFELLGRAGKAEARGCSLAYEEFLKKGGEID